MYLHLLSRQCGCPFFPSVPVWVTRSALSLFFPPLTRDNVPLLIDFFYKVTPEDLLFRFLTAMLMVSDDQIAYMMDVDHKQTEDFLAFVDDGALVGSAMIAIEPAGERAEVAIAVRADYKHQGVGWTLVNSEHGRASCRERVCKSG